MPGGPVSEQRAEEQHRAGLAGKMDGRLRQAVGQRSVELLAGVEVVRAAASTVGSRYDLETAVLFVGVVDVDHAVELRRLRRVVLPVREVLMPRHVAPDGSGLHQELGVEQPDVVAQDRRDGIEQRVRRDEGTEGVADELGIEELEDPRRLAGRDRRLPRHVDPCHRLPCHVIVEARERRAPGIELPCRQALIDHDEAALVKGLETCRREGRHAPSSSCHSISSGGI